MLSRHQLFLILAGVTLFRLVWLAHLDLRWGRSLSGLPPETRPRWRAGLRLDLDLTLDLLLLLWALWLACP